MRVFLAMAAALGTSLACGNSDSNRNLFGNGTGTGGTGGAPSDASAGSGGARSGGAPNGGGVTSTGGAGAGGGSGGSSNTGGASSTGGSWSSGGSGGTCQVTWCRDQDGDQHGDPTQTQVACASPGSDWTPVCDDCDDSETLVYPGADCQATAFTASDGVTLSFDYDCDGVETECGNFAKATTCGPAGPLSCAGGGYLTNPNRTATSGQNDYCGSTAYQNCVSIGLPCVPQATTMTAVICQ